MRLVAAAARNALALAVVLACGHASAAPDTPVQANPLAERLFQDGRALVEAGDHAGACAKFEASLKLDPRAVGTLLNIAMCKEATGKLATAWGLYREVAQRSRGTRPDRVEVAERKERELGERMSSLVLAVPKDHPRDMTLRVDGLALEEGAWSSALPADPGEHTVEAAAPGHASATVKVRVTGERQRVPVAVPTLARAAAAPSPKPTPAPPEAGGRGTRTLGIVLAGVGVVTLGVGAVLGVDVLARSGQPKELCPEPCARGSQAAEDSQKRYDALGTQATVTNVLLPVGGVLTLAGAYLWLVAGSPSPPPSARTGARLVVGPNGAGVVGAF